MMALFGLVDTARDPQLYRLVTASPEHACLFGGPIRPPLDRNAPYIAAVAPGTPLFDAWRDHGWGQSWGSIAGRTCRLPTCDGTCASSSKRSCRTAGSCCSASTTRGCGGPIRRTATGRAAALVHRHRMIRRRGAQRQRHDRLPARQWRAFGNRTLNADAFRFGASACCHGACTGHGALFGSFEIAAGSRGLVLRFDEGFDDRRLRRAINSYRLRRPLNSRRATPKDYVMRI